MLIPAGAMGAPWRSARLPAACDYYDGPRTKKTAALVALGLTLKASEPVLVEAHECFCLYRSSSAHTHIPLSFFLYLN